MLLCLFLSTPVLALIGAILATCWALSGSQASEATLVAYDSWEDVLEGLEEESTLDAGLEELERWIAAMPMVRGFQLDLPSYKVGRAYC